MILAINVKMEENQYTVMTFLIKILGNMRPFPGKEAFAAVGHQPGGGGGELRPTSYKAKAFMCRTKINCMLNKNVTRH